MMTRILRATLAGALPWLVIPGIATAQLPLYPAAGHGGNYMHNYYLPPAPSATPWAPAWSPDGRRIAFSMQGSIWEVDLESGIAAELTYDRRYHSSPNYSPDGEWLVFTADEGHRRIQLALLHLESGRVQDLTDDDQLYLDPVFSPDGDRLAYVSTRPNGYFNVFIRPFRDGAWAGEEIPITRNSAYPRSRLYFGPWDMHLQPAWTRDGRELLILSNREAPLGSGDVWRVPARRHGIDEAVSIHSEQSLYRTRPDVSVDGRRFLYSSTAGAADQFNHLYVLPVDGGEPYKMTFGDHDNFHPRWSPDGEKIAFVSNRDGPPQLWVMQTYGGASRRIEFPEYEWKRPVGRIEVRIVDQDEGTGVPARIQGLASDGKFYAPLESFARIGIRGRPFFHAPDSFTLVAPEGRMRLTAVRGFEYEPDEQVIEVRTDQSVEVVFRLRRVSHLAREGWFNGSTHLHMNYGGNLRNTLENLMFMSWAEDQNIVNELIANKDNRILDWQYFVPGGGEHPVSQDDPEMLVLVGEEYRPPFYGHVFMLGLRDHLISPFTTGYEGTAIESLYPSNTDMLRKAKAQGAVTGYVHPFGREEDPLEWNLGVAKAFPVDAVLGAVDALEWSNSSRGQLRVWHHALNNDLPIVPTGGEDAISDLHISKIVGSFRTYAYLGSDFSAASWLDSLRNGRTFFTSGPLLQFQVDDEIPGGVVRLPPSGGTIRLRGEIRSITPLSRVKIHRNGETFREIPLETDGRSARFDEEVSISSSGWFSLYAEGAEHPYFDVGYPQAATNTVRVYVGDEKIRNRESALYFVRWIDQLREMAREWPWWRSSREERHVLDQFDQARRKFLELAEEGSE